MHCGKAAPLKGRGLAESTVGVPGVEYHFLRHSAAKTDEYLYHQVFPYLGNKRRLLRFLADGIEATGPREGAFLDLFAGTGVVSRLAKVMGFRVIANDWEPYTEVFNLAYVVCDEAPPFEKLGGMEAAYERLNRLRGREGYISTYYCPCDDEAPDADRERMFFTQANGRRIDALRETIAEWEGAQKISRPERAALLASLVYAASYASNTSGVFKGFHRGWGGRTGTALYRIRGHLKVVPPVFFRGAAQGHQALREDANKLVGRMESVQIAYVDPPYNIHQYGPNYHLLNTVVLWDKPPLDREIRKDGRIVDKSAIRKDWRTERRSPYCCRDTAPDALSDLVEKVKARWVLLSYSADGLIPIERIKSILRAHGDLRILERPYKRYRVSPTRPSLRSHTTESLFVLRKRS